LFLTVNQHGHDPWVQHKRLWWSQRTNNVPYSTNTLTHSQDIAPKERVGELAVRIIALNEPLKIRKPFVLGANTFG